MLAEPGAAPSITMLDTAERLPWAGHTARHALSEIYGLIKRHNMTLIFVNTAFSPSRLPAALGMNDDNLAIALHTARSMSRSADASRTRWRPAVAGGGGDRLA